MKPQHPSLTILRPFSTGRQSCARSHTAALAHSHRKIAPYPYGPTHTYKQSNFGLYGGSHIQFDNQVSEEYEVKSRRTWKPNIQYKRLWSDALGEFLKIKVQARVLRTIDKVGGLDEYLLGGKAARIKELGMGGWKLRWRIMGSVKIKERFAREREALVVGKIPGVKTEKRLLDGRDKVVLADKSKGGQEKEDGIREKAEQKAKTLEFMEEIGLER